MLDELQSLTVSSRARFAISLAVLVTVFVSWSMYCGSKHLAGDVRFWGDLVHDFILTALCALRFRFLKMNQAWALLGFMPVVNLGVIIFLLVRGEPASERYVDT